jgi:hypothetical protein
VKEKGEFLLLLFSAASWTVDPYRTANDFREELKTNFTGALSQIIFPIAEGSSKRRVLGSFRDVFAEEN